MTTAAEAGLCAGVAAATDMPVCGTKTSGTLMGSESTEGIFAFSSISSAATLACSTCTCAGKLSGNSKEVSHGLVVPDTAQHTFICKPLLIILCLQSPTETALQSP